MITDCTGKGRSIIESCS